MTTKRESISKAQAEVDLRDWLLSDCKVLVEDASEIVQKLVDEGHVSGVENLKLTLQERPTFLEDNLKIDVAYGAPIRHALEIVYHPLQETHIHIQKPKRAPKRTLDQLLIESDEKMPKKKANIPPKDNRKVTVVSQMSSYANQLSSGEGPQLGGAILYFMKLFYDNNPPLALLKREHVIEKMVELVQDEDLNQTFVTGAMVVINSFEFKCPSSKIGPLDAQELCDILKVRLATNKHKQIASEMGTMIHNLTIDLGRNEMLEQGFVLELIKGIKNNREDTDIVRSYLRALHSLLYGESPPDNLQPVLNHLLPLLKETINVDVEVLVYHSARVLSCITMYEDDECAERIMELNLHSTIVQLLDVNTRIKLVALQMIEDLSYTADTEMFKKFLERSKFLKLLQDIILFWNRKEPILAACRILCNLCTANEEVIQALMNATVYSSLVHLVANFKDLDILEVVCWTLSFTFKNGSAAQLIELSTMKGISLVISKALLAFEVNIEEECELLTKLMIYLHGLLKLTNKSVKEYLSEAPMLAVEEFSNSHNEAVKVCAQNLLDPNKKPSQPLPNTSSSSSNELTSNNMNMPRRDKMLLIEDEDNQSYDFDWMKST